MLTEQEYLVLRDKYDVYELARNGRTVLTNEDRETMPIEVSNAERSQIEVYEFVNDPPERYFAYIKEEAQDGMSWPWQMTTWTGDYLGEVTYGSQFRDNFGGKRRNITVNAINGKIYYGTYFVSAGNYCRIRVRKADRLVSYLQMFQLLEKALA